MQKRQGLTFQPSEAKKGKQLTETQRAHGRNEEGLASFTAWGKGKKKGGDMRDQE